MITCAIHVELSRIDLRGTPAHASPMRDELSRVVEEILRPLLRLDGADIELLDVHDNEVMVRVHGNAAFGPGAEYIQFDVIDRAIRKVAGDAVKITIDKAFPKVIRQGDKEK